MTANTDESWVSLSDYLSVAEEYYWYDLHDDFPEDSDDQDDYPNVSSHLTHGWPLDKIREHCGPVT